MRKISSILLTFLLVLTLIPSFEVKAADESTLTIHFHRDDQNYEGWTLWTWDTNSGYDGEMHASYKDDFGLIFEYEVETGANVGFIIRYGDWEAKNCPDDQRIEVKADTEIWILQDDCEIYYENPTDLAGEREKINSGGDEVEDLIITDADAEAQLFIHYYRFDEQYRNWNIWSWVLGEEGNAYDFEDEDSYGKIAKINIGELTSDQVGFIVRLGNWQSKDIGSDRFVDFNNAEVIKDKKILHVYLVQGDETIYYDINDVDKTPKFKDATFDSLKEIRASSLLGFTDTEGVKVYKNDEEVAIESISLDDEEIVVTLSNDITLGDEYFIEKADLSDKMGITYNGIFDTEEFNETFLYTGDDLGLTFDENKTRFRLWAPTASNVSILVYTDGDYRKDNLEQSIEMKKDVQGTWILETDENLMGKYYTYEVTVAGNTNEAVDPYARAVGVNGHRAMIVDLTTTNPEGFVDHAAPEFKGMLDAIIYELHIRDLSTHKSSGINNIGKYLGLIETGTTNDDGLSTGLDHIKELGITHLHLLPAFDHRSINETKLEDNQFNWGYDPYNYNAPEGSYASDPYLGNVRVTEFKEMVQGLHDNGIRVVLDVVYNHTGASEDSHLNKIVPGYYYRTVAGNFSNGSGCGNETASERAMVRKMIVDSVKYWATEYKIDGFRFDLMALHDIDTMNEVREVLDKIDPNIIVYGEGWTGGTTPLSASQQALKVNVRRMPGIAVFSDDIRDGIKGSVFDDLDKGWVSGDYGKAARLRFGMTGGVGHPQALLNYESVSPDRMINYASAHDNLTLWDKLLVSNGEENTVQELIMMDKMANAIVLTSQGVPFIHAGAEILRTKGGDHNSYQSSDEVNQIDWNWKTEYIDVFNYYKGLIELRKSRDEFKLETKDEISKRIKFIDTERGVIAYSISRVLGLADTVVGFNATDSVQEIDLPTFGVYRVLVNGEEAGTKTLGYTMGTLEADAYSSYVLVNDSYIFIIGLIAIIGAVLAYFKFRKKPKRYVNA